MSNKTRTISSIAFFCLLFSVLVLKSAACESMKLFNQANNCYKEGKYQDAINLYSKIVDSGVESGNIYFNLGNCYFKNGMLGYSILSYERAKRFMPLSSDLKANYVHALGFVKDAKSYSRYPVNTLWAIYSFGSNIITTYQVGIFLEVVFILILVFCILSLYFRTIARRVRIAIFLMGIVFVAGAAYMAISLSFLHKEAVVVVEKADAKFEPFDRATTHFTICEGTKVLILERNEDWIKIERIDGKVGWLEENTAIRV